MKKLACLPGLAALALCLSLPGLAGADMRSGLDKALRAMDHAVGPAFQKIAVGGLVERTSGLPSPLCGKVEQGLRSGLRRSTSRQALEAGQDPSQADALLTGDYLRQGDKVSLRLVLLDPKDTKIWQGDCVLPASDFTAADFQTQALVPTAPSPDLATQQAAEEGQVIPKMPGSDGQQVPSYGAYYGGFLPFFHVDMSLGYKSFFPINSSFQSALGGQVGGLTLGLSFNDILLVDFDAWGKDVSGLGDLQSLIYTGTDFSLVYPLRLGNHFILYAGPGGRFGSLEADDSVAPAGSVVYGNNGFMAVAGAKVKDHGLGLDLRYTYDMSYSYTGYHTLTLGAFYEFGL